MVQQMYQRGKWLKISSSCCWKLEGGKVAQQHSDVSLKGTTVTFSITNNSQCQEYLICLLSLQTFWLHIVVPDLFLHMKEAWIGFNDIWFHLLFACSRVHVTVLICAAWSRIVGVQPWCKRKTKQTNKIHYQVQTVGSRVRAFSLQ